MATGVDAKLLKSTKFPAEFNQKVDMQKVNLQVMKKWIASKISDILGSEDDVVTELCFNLIEGSRFPDIKALQIQLTGFLDKDTAPFCKELWKLCLSAQTSPQGVPKELLEAKKLELIQEKIEADRLAEETRRRREDADRRDHNQGEARDRDRVDRGRGRGGDTWRGRGGDRDHEQRGRRGFGRGGNRSRSPPSRYSEQRDRGHYRGSARDSYVPRDRQAAGRDVARRRPATRSPSVGSASPQLSSRSPSVERPRRSSFRSPSPTGRRVARDRSPPDARHSRKRSRSPRRDEGRHSGYDSRMTKPQRPSRGNHSRSPSHDRRSPVTKRRRYSSSRSRSTSRRRRVAKSPTSSRSSDYSRSPTRSPERHPRVSRKGYDMSSGVRRQSLGHHDEDARKADPGDDDRESDGSGDSATRNRKSRKPARSGGSSRRQRRNTSSDSSLSRRRGRSADVSEDDNSEIKLNPQSALPTTSEEAKPGRSLEPSQLREKLLREQIKKMRTSNHGSSINGSG